MRKNFFSCRKVVKLSSRNLVLVRGRILGYLCAINFHGISFEETDVNFKTKKKHLMDFLAALKTFFLIYFIEVEARVEFEILQKAKKN